MQTATIRALSSAIVILVLVGCSNNDKQEPQLQLEIPGPPVADLAPPENLSADSCRAALEYEAELDRLRGIYTEDHPGVVRLRELAEAAKTKCLAATGQTFPPGKWREEDGTLECDGYLTRRADQDFCSADIPEDWVPFTFDGRTYYMQPLADSR